MPKIQSIKIVKPEFRDVKSWYDTHFDPQKIDHNDQEVYKYVYHEGRWASIFQCTSKGAQKFFMDAKPTSIVDIAALTSIFRPGPLAAHVDKLWLECKDSPYEWGHPLVNETLKETRNLLIFQEDVMNLAHKVGGFPLDQCDDVRRAIMKRNADINDSEKDKAKKLEEDFVAGAMKNGVPKQIAHDTYQRILWMSGYSFNRCLSPDQKIYTFNDCQKQLKQLKDVKVGDVLQSRDEKTQETICVKVKNVHYNGKKKLVKVKLKTGEEIKCTLDHKFRVQETGEMLPLWIILKNQLNIIVTHAIKNGQNN